MIKISLTNDQAIDILKNYLAFVNQVSIDDISVSIESKENEHFLIDDDPQITINRE